MHRKNIVNMKKVLLFLFLSFPVILTWGTTVSVWQGSKTFSTWSDVLNISGSNFSKVKADDVVVFSGDDYVDIVARDGYPKDNNTHLSQAADFRRLRQARPNKMTALPETNSVPSWENMVNDNALWLIVAPWCGGTAFDNGNTADFWQHFLNDAEGIISRNEVK